eukprot:UN03372
MSNLRILAWQSQSEQMINKYLKYIQTENKSFTHLWEETNNNFLDQSLNFMVLRRNIARWNAYYNINKSLICNEMERKSEEEIYMERSKYVFILSPFGGGMDCYRTWEALMAGHIVIVQTSPLNALYQGLPVVIVKDWNEISHDKLQLWYDLYFFNHTAQNNPSVTQKLTIKYWVQRMKRLIT